MTGTGGDRDRRDKVKDRREKEAGGRRKEGDRREKVKDGKGKERREVGKSVGNSLILNIEAMPPPKCLSVRAKMATNANRWDIIRNFNHRIIFIIIGRSS